MEGGETQLAPLLNRNHKSTIARNTLVLVSDCLGNAGWNLLINMAAWRHCLWRSICSTRTCNCFLSCLITEPASFFFLSFSLSLSFSFSLFHFRVTLATF